MIYVDKHSMPVDQVQERPAIIRNPLCMPEVRARDVGCIRLSEP